MAQVALIGEVMMELSPHAVTTDSSPVMALSFAGDTYNTCVYLARLGINTDYVTLLGDDPYSLQILGRMRDENIGTDLITQTPGRTPGLYLIRNTPDGEREFFYWRKEAPARELFSSPEMTEQLLQKLKHSEYIYLTGVTLAIIGETARALLLNTLKTLRASGAKVVFDSNYRPRLWKDVDEARTVMGNILSVSDIALLTLEDEQALWNHSSIDACIKHNKTLGISELIIKRGAQDTHVIYEQQQFQIAVPPVNNIVDTTGAGDSFNAGYLAARIKGATPAEAAEQGNHCASIIIRYRGGVIEKSIFKSELNA